MTFKVYDICQPDTSAGNSYCRILGVNLKQRRLSLSSQLVRDHGLKAGDKLLLARDEDKPGDWYITVGTDLPNGMRLYGNGAQLVAQNRTAVRDLLMSVNATEAASLLVAAKPTRIAIGDVVFWYRLLTANPIRKR